MSAPIVPCKRSWSISENSLRRYVEFASESCIQDLLAASVPQNAAGYNWKVLATNDGVEISKRPCGSLHIFRNRWELGSVFAQQFIVGGNAIDAAKEWNRDLVEAKYIKDLSDNLSIIRLRFGDSSKPLFKNREFIVYLRRKTMDDDTLVFAVASSPKMIAAGLHPKQSDIIRGLLFSGFIPYRS